MKKHTKTTLVLLSLFCIGDRHSALSAVSTDPHGSVCRISNQVQGAGQFGSGTLIDKTGDGREGLVLTCAHLFRAGVGDLVVRFSDGRSHQATLVEIDHRADLAALAITRPAGEPVAIAYEVSAASKLRACGFGPQGIYRCAVGSSLGQAVSPGQVSLLIGDVVRSGDSGGGVFDDRGRLVAVIWGAAQGVTYASSGKPLQSFLNRVLNRRSATVVSCPGGICPQRPPDLGSSDRSGNLFADSRWRDFQRQLEWLRTQKQDRGDYLTRSELPDFDAYVRQTEIERIEVDAAARYASLRKRLQSLDGRSAGRALGAAIVGWLGLSGPIGWAVVAAASVGGWLVGRRMQRRFRGVRGRRRRRFRSPAAG